MHTSINIHTHVHIFKYHISYFVYLTDCDEMKTLFIVALLLSFCGINLGNEKHIVGLATPPVENHSSRLMGWTGLEFCLHTPAIQQFITKAGKTLWQPHT